MLHWHHAGLPGPEVPAGGCISQTAAERTVDQHGPEPLVLRPHLRLLPLQVSDARAQEGQLGGLGRGQQNARLHLHHLGGGKTPGTSLTGQSGLPRGQTLTNQKAPFVDCSFCDYTALPII